MEKIYKSGARIKKIINGENCFYICGIFPSDGYISKIDGEGNLIWENFYSNVQTNDIYFDLNSNSVMVAGAIYDNLLYGYVLKLDTAGNTLTQKQFKILRQGTNCTHIVKYKTDYFIAGTSLDSNIAYSVSYFVRVTSNIDTTYKKIFSSTKDETVGSFFIKNQNKLMFSTRVLSYLIGDTLKIKLFSTDTLGNISEIKTFARIRDCKINAGIFLNSKYNLYAGYLDSLGNNIWVIKTDSLFNFNPVGIVNNNIIIVKDFHFHKTTPILLILPH